jgi:hypothetical protein
MPPDEMINLIYILAVLIVVSLVTATIITVIRNIKERNKPIEVRESFLYQKRNFLSYASLSSHHSTSRKDMLWLWFPIAENGKIKYAIGRVHVNVANEIEKNTKGILTHRGQRLISFEFNGKIIKHVRHGGYVLSKK